MSMHEGDDWVARLIAAFNSHDADLVGSFCTDDVEYVFWSDDAWATVRGREAVVELIAGFAAGWSSDFSLTETLSLVTERGFAVEYREGGTQDRGPDPTGRRFALRNVMVGELRDGLVSRMTDYSDVVAYRTQMGDG